MVPNLATGVWVGGEDRSVHFKQIAFGQGATMALPIWANYMRSLYENPDFGISKDDFLPPEEMSIPVECEKISVNNLNYNISPKEDLDALGF